MFKFPLSFTFLKTWRAKRLAQRVANQEAQQAAHLAKMSGTIHNLGPQVAVRLVRKDRARARRSA